MKKPKYFAIFVHKYPEENCGYIALPSDTKKKEITLVTQKKYAHKYPNVEDGKGSFEDWKKIFEEDGYFKDEEDLRDPVFKCSYFEDEEK